MYSFFFYFYVFAFCAYIYIYLRSNNSIHLLWNEYRKIFKAHSKGEKNISHIKYVNLFATLQYSTNTYHFSIQKSSFPLSNFFSYDAVENIPPTCCQRRFPNKWRQIHCWLFQSNGWTWLLCDRTARCLILLHLRQIFFLWLWNIWQISIFKIVWKEEKEK